MKRAYVLRTTWNKNSKSKPPSQSAGNPYKNKGFVLGRKKPPPIPNTVILDSSKTLRKTSKTRRGAPPWDLPASCAPQSGQDGSAREPL